MGMSPLNVNEIPGGLFTMEHWMKIAVELLTALININPQGWKVELPPASRAWATEYLEYTQREQRLAREKALAKLTWEDKKILGLEK